MFQLSGRDPQCAGAPGSQCSARARPPCSSLPWPSGPTVGFRLGSLQPSLCLTPLCRGRLADLCFLFPGKGDLIGCELPRREQVVKANADVKGLTYCVLQCLQLAGLHESLALYPEFALRFSQGLRGELSYNLGAGGGPPEVRVLGMCMEEAGVPGSLVRGAEAGLCGGVCEYMAWMNTAGT